MPQSLADRYRRWFEYEKDAHRKVLTALQSAPTDAHSSPAFAKAITLMGHVVAARRRFGAAAEGPGLNDFFPTGLSVADLAAQVQAVHAAWDDYLARLDDAALARMFRYKSLDAGWFQNTVEDILTQMFGHSWYHRGQIATLLKSAGVEPPVTDFVYWVREPIPAPDASAP
jgi:uncharacterized damage-inducible protein DinB